MRLIDADELAERVTNLEAVALEQVAKLEPSEEHEKWKVWSAILNERTAFKFDLFDAPTVDAVEVVRCKDCKYYIADGCDECVLMSAKSIIAGINNKRWYSDFYCAWGERREDGKTD